MNYATGCAFNFKDMFINFDKSKLHFNSKDCERLINDAHKDKLIEKIALEGLQQILNDVIDNNATFYLPTGGRESTIHIRQISGDEFKKSRKHGKFKDVDYLESNFTGNQMELTMNNGKRVIRKPIYLNKELKNKITQNTNEGKQYC